MQFLYKRFIYIVCGTILCALGYGQTKKPLPKAKPTSTKTTATVKKPVASSNTLLWKITGNGLKKPSYIFGTMHLLCADDAKLSPNLKTAINESEQIYFEIDMDDFSQLIGTIKYIRMNDNVKLSDLLTKEEYARIKMYFEKNPAVIPFAMMERFKPFMLTSLLSESGMGCEKTNGMEMTILEEAKKGEKEIKGLETTEFQASLFDSIPYDKQAKELLNYIDSIDKYKKSTEELLQVYKKQDLKKMMELTTKSESGIENYLELLLYSRNRHWMGDLNWILRAKPTLIAVGAGHLPGEEGMLNLLKKAGFTLTPVPNVVP